MIIYAIMASIFNQTKFQLSPLILKIVQVHIQIKVFKIYVLLVLHIKLNISNLIVIFKLQHGLSLS